MAATQYTLLFKGGIRAGYEPAAVKERLGELLKLDDDGLAQLFSGRLITLKRGLRQEDATRYQQALERTGAEILLQGESSEVEAVEAVVSTVEPEPEPASNDASLEQGAAGETLHCPRCAHVQGYRDQCARCKMDLRRHIMKLQRRAKAQKLRRAG